MFNLDSRYSSDSGGINVWNISYCVQFPNNMECSYLRRTMAHKTFHSSKGIVS